MNLAIILAKMNSQRLPGKALLPLAGVPMIGRVIERTIKARMIDDIVLAVTDDKEDAQLVRLAYVSDIMTHVWDKGDVLGQVINCIRYPEGNIIIITGDCPLVDPELIDDCIKKFINFDIDYLSTTHMAHSTYWKAQRTFPKGVAVQVVKPRVLEEVEAETRGDTEIRSHATMAIYHRPEQKYKLYAFQAIDKYAEWNHPELNLAVDTREDYDRMVKIWDSLPSEFSTLDVIKEALK